MILAADVGGTKTRVGLFELAGGNLHQTEGELYRSGAHESLLEILDAFLATRDRRLDAAGIGIAGPVVRGRSEATNLPWIVDATKLARRLGTTAALVNDLEATAHALPLLGSSDLRALNRGRRDPEGNQALIAAGTGLGEALIVRADGRFLVSPSEGGHCTFAPRDEAEIALQRFLAKRYGHVSYERLLSGPGLVNIYDFLGELRSWKEPGTLKPWRSDAHADMAPVITRAALAGESPRAVEALRLFASIYGAEAGNLALKGLSTGGLYIGGGIAPKILTALEDGHFMRAFLAKGRFGKLLSTVPVAVVLNDRAALIGAAAIARSLASGFAAP